MSFKQMFSVKTLVSNKGLVFSCYNSSSYFMYGGLMKTASGFKLSEALQVTGWPFLSFYILMKFILIFNRYLGIIIINENYGGCYRVANYT